MRCAKARAMRRLSSGIVFPILLLSGPMYSSAQPTPVVPSLESYDAQLRRRPVEDEAPSQALPTVMTICADRAARRCWTEAGATACETEEGKAEVFAVVAVNGAESEGPVRLERCWSEMKRLAE